MAFIVAAIAGAALLTHGTIAGCDAEATTLAIDLTNSSIRWRGTKFWGLGSHEGTVDFHSGILCVRSGVVVSGWFEADMTTIAVTDIPEHEPVPQRRLLRHLASEDFFHIAAHPRARFVVRSVEHESDRLYRVDGDLTIRGRTHPVTFYARGWSVTDREVRAEARLEIDRHKYDVSYRGSTIKDDLVDDTFWLELVIVARSAKR